MMMMMIMMHSAAVRCGFTSENGCWHIQWWYSPPFHQGSPMGKLSQSGNLMGGLLSGVGVEGGDPACGGPWHGGTFEWGRYYGGECGGHVNSRQTLHYFLPLWNIFFNSLYIPMYIPLKIYTQIPIYQPSPIPPFPAPPCAWWLVHNYFCCFAVHSRSQWGAVCVASALCCGQRRTVFIRVSPY